MSAPSDALPDADFDVSLSRRRFLGALGWGAAAAALGGAALSRFNAASALAPHCAHCDCRVLGHGVESDGHIYCCAHCARESGVEGLTDRA